MKDISAIIFPHSYLPESIRDRILASFDSITVCQPWYMGPAADTENSDGRITIVRPPEDLKPLEDFRKLLSEYRLWMRENHGYFPLRTGDGEDTTWEIRHALRQIGEEVHERVQEQALKWHLILHLDRELEEDRASADEMLLRIKAEKSPLAEALGEANHLQGLLDDLPPSDSHPSKEERHLRQVLVAWFGLFGHSLPDGCNLLTIAPDVLSYAAEIFGIGLPEPSGEKGGLFLRTIHLPKPPVDPLMDEDPVRSGLSGKILILAEHG